MKATEEKTHVCSICQSEFGDTGFGHGFGNNAQPINDGRCCDRCNAGIVIPARLNQIVRTTKK